MKHPEHSLRKRLLTRLWIPLASVLLLGALLSFGLAYHFGNVVHDRWLLDSATTLATQLRADTGKLILDLPQSAVEMFEWDSVDRIYEEVTSPSGRLLFGNAAFPKAPADLAPNLPRYYDATIGGNPVRVVAIAVASPADASKTVTIQVAETKKNFDAIWQQVRNSVVAFGFQESGVEAMSVSEEERRRVFQENWDKGNGFRFMFGTFRDIATNPEANAAAAAFIRSKIKEIVKDPETARKLTPTGLYAKRPLCNEGYYESFNRDNVTLVSIEENPIEAITPAGLRTADGVEHKLDVLVFATGFDAVDGNYRSMDLRGRGGRHINEGWAAGPSSYLGLSTHGFPNLFMILGPNGPFTNLPPSIESQVDWISETIGHAERSGVATVEPSREAEDAWVAQRLDGGDTQAFRPGVIGEERVVS